MPRLAITGYGTLELNQAEKNIMESQCKLDATDFPDGAEVGTIVSVDKASGLLKKPAKALPKAMIVNSERLFNQYHQGLNQYILEAGAMGSVLYLTTGTKFTTNTLGGDTDPADMLDDVGTTPTYLEVGTDGIMEVTQTASANVFAEVVKDTTMPDGQRGAKILVTKGAVLDAAYV